MGWIKPKNHLATVPLNIPPPFSHRETGEYIKSRTSYRGVHALFSVHALFFILHLPVQCFGRSLTQPPLTLRLKVYYKYVYCITIHYRVLIWNNLIFTLIHFSSSHLYKMNTELTQSNYLSDFHQRSWTAARDIYES